MNSDYVLLLYTMTLIPASAAASASIILHTAAATPTIRPQNTVVVSSGLITPPITNISHSLNPIYYLHIFSAHGEEGSEDSDLNESPSGARDHPLVQFPASWKNTCMVPHFQAVCCHDVGVPSWLRDAGPAGGSGRTGSHMGRWFPTLYVIRRGKHASGSLQEA